ncbi:MULTISPECIES: c-type cytochrome [Arenibacter]|uniref:c-type cytochrome n=1 Tax=Arenibacter TaxID=178469 RepID=UPI0012FFF32F|nr:MULTISPECIES: c-type cytochrome [Arenibacter]
MRQNMIIGIIFSVCLYLFLGFSSFQIQENNPPEIRIIVPVANSTFSWNSILPYEIQVLDDEDGNSEYDEINPNEVLLVVKYLHDLSEVKTYLQRESNTNYKPLFQMGNSSCFNCHRAKGTLIGPSFERIAAKYNNDQNAIESLAEKIITGSTSFWGDEKMPPHPDLMVGQVQEMVQWILANNLDSNKNYLAGIKGTIKTKEQSESVSEKGIIVLTARYSDHGSNDQRHNSKQAQVTLILKSD